MQWARARHSKNQALRGNTSIGRAQRRKGAERRATLSRHIALDVDSQDQYERAPSTLRHQNTITMVLTAQDHARPAVAPSQRANSNIQNDKNDNLNFTLPNYLALE